MSRNVVVIGWVAVLGVAFAAETARAEFKRGYLYISTRGRTPCTGGTAGVLEINPQTGEGRVFSSSAENPSYCSAGGLRFTPDGSRLLMISSFVGILAFDGEGNSEVYLTGADGLVSPSGENALAFDRHGDLFVKSSSSSIRRFPADGGPYSVFANQDDGVPPGSGALDFAPDGDLFFCGDSSHAFGVTRFTPDGTGIKFDDPPGSTRSLAVSRFGYLYVVGGGAIIFRYHIGDPASRIVLASGFTPQGIVPRVLTVSPDGDTVFYADYATELLYRIDAWTGETQLLANMGNIASFFSLATGMAIYSPPIPGDLNGDDQVNLSDFEFLHSCQTTIGVPIAPMECHFSDLNVDGRVDILDFGKFQTEYGAPSEEDTTNTP